MPNPFQNHIRIFTSGEQAIVRDIAGRIVNRLTRAFVFADMVWEGRDYQVKKPGAGGYFVTGSGLPPGRVLTVVKLGKKNNGQ